MLPLLQAESADAEATPYSPWGIRLKNKIALNKHELFLDGTLEVQDEGSQLLALLVGAKRGSKVPKPEQGAVHQHTVGFACQSCDTGIVFAADAFGVDIGQSGTGHARFEVGKRFSAMSKA